MTQDSKDPGYLALAIASGITEMRRPTKTSENITLDIVGYVEANPPTSSPPIRAKVTVELPLGILKTLGWTIDSKLTLTLGVR